MNLLRRLLKYFFCLFLLTLQFARKRFFWVVDLVAEHRMKWKWLNEQIDGNCQVVDIWSLNLWPFTACLFTSLSTVSVKQSRNAREEIHLKYISSVGNIDQYFSYRSSNNRDRHLRDYREKDILSVNIAGSEKSYHITRLSWLKDVHWQTKNTVAFPVAFERIPWSSSLKGTGSSVLSHSLKMAQGYSQKHQEWLNS